MLCPLCLSENLPDDLCPQLWSSPFWGHSDLTSDPDGFKAMPAYTGGPGVDPSSALSPQVTGHGVPTAPSAHIQPLLWLCRSCPAVSAVLTAASAGPSPTRATAGVALRPPFSPFPPDTPRLPFSLVLCSWEGHSGPDKNALGPGLLSSRPAHDAREAVSQGPAKVLSASPGGSPSRSARACGHRPGFAAVSGLRGSALRPGLAAHGLSLPVHPRGRREPRCFPEKRRRGESSSVQLLGPGQPHCSWLRKGPGPAGPTGMCARILVSGYSCACVYAYVRACVRCVQSVHAHTACLGGCTSLSTAARAPTLSPGAGSVGLSTGDLEVGLV